MNRIQVSGLQSRVARRLFVLFLLAAMVPLGGLAFFAYLHVNDMLVELNYRRLQQDAKAVGMSLVQRLRWREQALLHLAARYSAPTGSGGGGGLPARSEGFRSLEVVELASIGPLAALEESHLRRSRVLLQISEKDGPSMLIQLPGSSHLLKGRLETDSLWWDEEAAEPYCILSASGGLLYCTPGLAVSPGQQWPQQLTNLNSGVFAWQIGAEDHLAAYWNAQMQASLGSQGFIMVVTESKKEVLAILTRFRQIFPPIMILALALAAWLAISQIRRQMRPLDQLEKHTRELARGDFSSRIDITGNDEFTSLAESFNRMSESLNCKFHLLQALGELDRAILAVSEIEVVIETLLRHVRQAVHCDGAAVVRFDQEGGVRLWLATIGPDKRPTVTKRYLDGTTKPAWGRDQPWFQLDLAAAGTEYLQPFADAGASLALVFPARIGERFDAALLLAYRQLPQDTGEIVQGGRSLADRLTAGASNIAWEEKLYRQAHYDPLTDLPNRVLLRDRLDQALLRAQREGQVVAVMLVDLDDFKQVNDSLGHSAGDMLLVSLAARLKRLARGSDTVARLGGDEFIVMVPDLPAEEAIDIVDRIARKLSSEFSRAIDIGGRRVSSSASIGIALFPENGSDIENLLKNADAAMYESKRGRRGGYHFYSSRMNATIGARFELAQELREAMERQEFHLVFQPKVAVDSGRIIGAEALIRWASPGRGIVSPGRFIPIIDEIGLGARLGAWVIDAACAQMAAWDVQGHAPFPVSVNVSPAQFHSGEIITQVRQGLAKHGLDARRLELEILESMAVGDSANANATLGELRGIGVSIALDDFGTGYSSLVYLTQLPANVLKIDRGFIVNLLPDGRQQAIVERIISLAKVLHYTVVAEGVEDRGQATLLAAMGCDVFQGNLFSKPVRAEEFAALLQAPPFVTSNEC
jgi:diguanylate cyclase (GGDEF)-like protein